MLDSAKYKNIATEVLDVDTSSRTIVAYVSKFGNIDLDGDMIMEGAYKRSILERGKGAKDELFHLSNHRIQPEFVLSKATFEEDSFGLKMTSTLRNTQHANDILEGYKSNTWNQHSVMFTVPKGKYDVKNKGEASEHVVIYEAKLYEGSTVIWGANPETPVIEMKNHFKQVYESDIKKAFEHLQSLTKACKTGSFSDEFFPLLDIQIKLLESIVLENFTQKSIESVVETIQPPSEGEQLLKWYLSN